MRVLFYIVALLFCFSDPLYAQWSRERSPIAGTTSAQRIRDFLSDASRELPRAFAACVKQDVEAPRTREEESAFWRQFKEGFKRWSEASKLRDTTAVIQMDAIARVWWESDTVWREAMACRRGLQSKILIVVEELSKDEEYLDDVQRFASQYLANSISEQEFLKIVVKGVFGAQVIREARHMGDPHTYDFELLNTSELYGGFSRGLSRAHTILGKIALKQVQLSRAQQEFESAHRLRPRAAAPKIGLGMVAEQQGKMQEALLHYAGATLGEMRNPDAAEHFENAYRTFHGSLDGADELLDSLYEHSTTYGIFFPTHRKPNVSPKRRVLVQYQTWVRCGPCTVHDLAVEAAERSRSPGDVIVLSYHYYAPFIAPGFHNRILWNYYYKSFQDYTQSTGHCLGVYVDGRCPSYVTTKPGSLWPIASPGYRIGAHRLYDRLQPDIDARLQVERGAAIHASARKRNGQIAVQVRIDSVRPTQHQLRVHMVLTEDAIRFPGQDGIRIQRHVVRSIAGDSATGFGYQVSPSATIRADHTFDLAMVSKQLREKNEAEFLRLGGSNADGSKRQLPPEVYTLNQDRLRVVVYIQDDSTGEVLDVVAIPAKEF